jgi:predicted  nucleic acid-binding Zn-ribbon protein
VLNRVSPNAELPPVIPSFQHDLNEAWQLIGQKEQYLLQLQKTLLTRAQEVNRLDDELKAARARIAELEAQHDGSVDLLAEEK